MTPLHAYACVHISWIEFCSLLINGENQTLQKLFPSTWYFSLLINVPHCTVVSGEDYTEINAETLDQFLMFDDANRRLSFNVTIISDNQSEKRENFSLELRFDPFLVNVPAGVTLSPDVTIITIEDDDTPGM